jgi:hypothetical protein
VTPQKKQCCAMTPDGEGGYDYCVLDKLPRHGTHKTWEGREFERVIYVRRKRKKEHSPHTRTSEGIVERASKVALRAAGLTEWAPAPSLDTACKESKGEQG